SASCAPTACAPTGGGSGAGPRVPCAAPFRVSWGETEPKSFLTQSRRALSSAGDLDPESCCLSLAADAGGALMRARDRSDNREPEARAGLLLLAALERFEEPVGVRRQDPRSEIGHLEAAGALAGERAQLHGGPLRVLRGVVEEVQDRLGQPLRVGRDRLALRGAGDVEPPVEERPCLHPEPVDELTDADGSLGKRG